MGAAAAMLAAVLLLTPITVPAGYPGAVAPATAACPDAEVVFARGRFEPPGIGTVGNAFVSALRSKVNKNVGVYAVKYPADNQIDVGANDMSAHIQSMANSCPNTRLVPGGYSLGAAVTDVVLAVPTQMWGFTNPLPPGSDEHIAAVALFGNGSQWVGPITKLQPRLQRSDHRVVSRRRPRLPPCRPQHLGGQLAPAPRRGLCLVGHGQPGG